MAEDTRNFIEHSQARASLIRGNELTAAEMATEFARLGPAERVDHLDRLNVDLAGNELSIGEAARLVEFTSALRTTHERLRKVDR